MEKVKPLFAPSDRRQKPPVYTVEECQSCKEKPRRPFQVGDFVFGTGKECSFCKSPKTEIKMIYVESIKPGRSHSQ